MAVSRETGKSEMRFALKEKPIFIAMPLIFGIASLIIFAIYYWSCNHAPYNYIDIILAGPPLSFAGVIISVITRKSRHTYPNLWGFGLLSCLAGFIICVAIIILLISILIAAFEGRWL